MLVFTFILMMDPIAQMAQTLLAKGVSVGIIVRALVTLIPQALAITIPMAFLLGLLVAFGRLSGDSRVDRPAGLRRQPDYAAAARPDPGSRRLGRHRSGS